MTWNDAFALYVGILIISGAIVASIIIRDLVTGRYKRLRRMQKEFSTFEKEVAERRKRILGEETTDE